MGGKRLQAQPGEWVGWACRDCPRHRTSVRWAGGPAPLLCPCLTVQILEGEWLSWLITVTG